MCTYSSTTKIYTEYYHPYSRFVAKPVPWKTSRAKQTNKCLCNIHSLRFHGKKGIVLIPFATVVSIKSAHDPIMINEACDPWQYYSQVHQSLDDIQWSGHWELSSWTCTLSSPSPHTNYNSHVSYLSWFMTLSMVGFVTLLVDGMRTRQRTQRICRDFLFIIMALWSLL